MALKLAIRLDETIGGHTQKKDHCPGCNKKRYVRFYDFSKDEFLPIEFGRCDRQEHCGYFVSPYSENSGFVVDQTNTAKIEVPDNPIKYVDKAIVAQTLSKYETNTFVQFLISKVGHDKAMAAVFKLYIGTAKNNGTIFWQIDQFNKPRTAAKIHYLEDGHRDKEIDVKRLFVLKDGYKPCLFGEHQILNSASNCVFAIVESEKTASLGECYMNEVNNRPVVWLASSGSNGLTFDKIQCLRGKDVMLVPDFSFHARATWGLLPMRKKPKPDAHGKMVMSIDEEGDVVDYESAKDRFVSMGCNVTFFDPCPEVKDGSDIADLFVKENAPEDPKPPKNEVKISMPDLSKFEINIGQSNLKPRTFDEEISIRSLITGKHNITLSLGPNYVVKCQMNNMLLQNKMDEYFSNNPMLSKLIHKFDLGDGSVSIYN